MVQMKFGNYAGKTQPMKTKLLLAFLFPVMCATAQNLVPNGDFEQFSGCPHDPDRLDSALFWMNTSPDVPNSGTPDYFNACDTLYVDVPDNAYYGYQQARSGVGYAGIILYTPYFGGNIREYIEIELTQPLTAGWHYHFEMYMTVPNNFVWASDDIGVYFSDTAVTNVTNWAPLPFAAQIQNPQGNLPDTTNWIAMTGDYWGTGGETHMIIGNFRNDFQTSATPVNLGGNSYAYIYIDDVSLTHSGTGLEEEVHSNMVSTYPNPASDRLNVTATVPDQLRFTLFDPAGKMLKTEIFCGTTTISLDGLAQGVYIYEVSSENGLLDRGKFIKE
jgi:hypothetical protein